MENKVKETEKMQNLSTTIAILLATIFSIALMFLYQDTIPDSNQIGKMILISLLCILSTTFIVSLFATIMSFRDKDNE